MNIAPLTLQLIIKLLKKERESTQSSLNYYYTKLRDTLAVDELQHTQYKISEETKKLIDLGMALRELGVDDDE